MSEDLLADLRRALSPPLVVLCVGNPLRGDDGFGPAVAGRLAAHPEVIDAGTTPENFLPRVSRLGVGTVLLVDAVHFGGRAGELRLLDPADLRLDDFSTHAASLAICAEFLRQAGGVRTMLLACQPAGTDLGAEMSQEVAAAVTETARVLERLLSCR